MSDIILIIVGVGIAYFIYKLIRSGAELEKVYVETPSTPTTPAPAVEDKPTPAVVEQPVVEQPVVQSAGEQPAPKKRTRKPKTDTKPAATKTAKKTK